MTIIFVRFGNMTYGGAITKILPLFISASECDNNRDKNNKKKAAN